MKTLEFTLRKRTRKTFKNHRREVAIKTLTCTAQNTDVKVT